MGTRRIAACKKTVENGGSRYRFYCELSGALACVTDPIRAETPEEELRIAWETVGIKYFNLCHKCGRWVIDAAYNVDVLECVECAPYEAEPRFCKNCGVKIETPGRKCPVCGNSLVYEGGGTSE
ncbi:MAG: hypothetical protein IJF78_16185 [Clostridia bacterium]|nr:hypothetical protein [Clostridia bacterium]